MWKLAEAVSRGLPRLATEHKMFPTRHFCGLNTRIFSHLQRRMSSTNARVESIPNSDLFDATVDSDGRLLSISDSSLEFSSYAFEAAWLWVNDPKSIHATSGQKMRTLGKFSVENHRLQDARIVTEESISETSCNYPLSPPGSYHARGGVYETSSSPEPTTDGSSRKLVEILWIDGDRSYFDWEWLIRLSPRTLMISNGDEPTRVTSAVAIGAVSNPRAVRTPRLDYNHVLSTEEGRFEAMNAIVEHGVVLMEEAPIVFEDSISENSISGEIESDSTVSNLGKLFSGGRLSHGSLYGDTFRVQSQAGAHNIAYTTVALPPHQDLTYYESKPFLQLLHCVSTTKSSAQAAGESHGETGASVLIDAMAAGEYLRVVAPDLFEILTKVEATFLKQREGADMVSFKPHIVTSSATGEVVEINWSPPFEGPLLMQEDGYTRKADGSAITMEDYVRAYQAMEVLLDNHAANSTAEDATTLLSPSLHDALHEYSNAHTWEFILQPGDLLVFNNQRMCHGRRAFRLDPQETGSTRHLIGCYTDAMETITQYRLLLRSRGLGESMRNVGNGTRGSPI